MEVGEIVANELSMNTSSVSYKTNISESTSMFVAGDGCHKSLLATLGKPLCLILCFLSNGAAFA